MIGLNQFIRPMILTLLCVIHGQESYLYAIEGVNGCLTAEIATEVISDGEGSPWSLFHQGQQPRSVILMTHLSQLLLTLLHKFGMVM